MAALAVTRTSPFLGWQFSCSIGSFHENYIIFLKELVKGFSPVMNSSSSCSEHHVGSSMDPDRTGVVREAACCIDCVSKGHASDERVIPWLADLASHGNHVRQRVADVVIHTSTQNDRQDGGVNSVSHDHLPTCASPARG